MKIKQIAKYLLPIVIVVGIVVAFLLSRMSQPTGRDNVLTGNVDLPQDSEGNYISQRYESNLIPSDTDFTVNDQPVDNVIRVDDGESGDDSDYIYIEIADTDIKDLYKKDDLMEGHQATNTTTVITDELANKTEYKELDENLKLSYNGPLLGVPFELAYDTIIVERTIEDSSCYIGMLYGKWPYYLSTESVNEYNITTELVIASFYSGIVLAEENNTKTVLTDGYISEMTILD